MPSGAKGTMLPTMRVPIDTQRRLYAEHAETAFDALIERMVAERSELIALGAARAFRDVGVHEYGDSTYHKSDEQLADETDAELADAIFYQHIRVAKRLGALD